MAFLPRTFDQILTDMVAYMQTRTIVSDYNVGSVIRTILEAAALEDDEQYFQMVQLLDLFSYTTAAGEDLDRRLADFGITRRSAKPATALVKFYDNNLVRTRLGIDITAGSLFVNGFDTTRFPTTGYPYTVRVGEGTARQQNLEVTNNDTSTGTMTISSATTSDLFIGDRLAFVTGGSLFAPVAPSSSSRFLPIGTEIQAPPTVNETARIYTTIEPATILQGNYESNEVIVKCTTSGLAGNIGTGRISQWASSPPFVGGAVSNITQAQGGLDAETDIDLRTRALQQLAALGLGTVLALKSKSIGVEDPVSQSRVISSNIVEDFANDEVILYIDDGTGSSARTQILPSDSIASDILAGASGVPLVNSDDWPESGWLYIEDSTDPELLQYDANTFYPTTTTPLAFPHLATTIVNFVDVLSSSTEATQRRLQFTNFPLVRGSERVWIQPPSGVWRLLSRTEYNLNRGTGEFQWIDVGGFLAGTKVISHYIYYTNLIAEVQKVMEGDPLDPTRYPGVKAAGTFLVVEEPTIKRVTVVASITAAEGYSESFLAPQVRRAIESYISSLRIGRDVIKSKLIDVAFSVVGLEDIRIITPTANITVLESELPLPFDGSGASLVQVL